MGVKLHTWWVRVRMHLRRCHNFNDFRRLAKRRLSGPIFDYIDGAADDDVTHRRNTKAFETCDLVPSGSTYGLFDTAQLNPPWNAAVRHKAHLGRRLQRYDWRARLQPRPRSLAPAACAVNLGQRIGKSYWLGELGNVSLGHGVSLLRVEKWELRTPPRYAALPLQAVPLQAVSNFRT